MATLRTNKDVPSPFLRLVAGLVFGVFFVVLCAASLHSHEPQPAGEVDHNDCQLCHVTLKKVVLADVPEVSVVHCHIAPPATQYGSATFVASAPQYANGPPRAPPIELA